MRRPGRSSYGRCRRRWMRRLSCASRPRPRGNSATWTTPPKWCAPGPLRFCPRLRSSADAAVCKHVQVEIRAAVAEVLESGNSSGKQWWRGGRGKENRSPRAAESPAAEGQEPVRNKRLPPEPIPCAHYAVVGRHWRRQCRPPRPPRPPPSTGGHPATPTSPQRRLGTARRTRSSLGSCTWPRASHHSPIARARSSCVRRTSSP